MCPLDANGNWVAYSSPAAAQAAEDAQLAYEVAHPVALPSSVSSDAASQAAYVQSQNEQIAASQAAADAAGAPIEAAALAAAQQVATQMSTPLDLTSSPESAAYQTMIAQQEAQAAQAEAAKNLINATNPAQAKAAGLQVAAATAELSRVLAVSLAGGVPTYIAPYIPPQPSGPAYVPPPNQYVPPGTGFTPGPGDVVVYSSPAESSGPGSFNLDSNDATDGMDYVRSIYNSGGIAEKVNAAFSDMAATAIDVAPLAPMAEVGAESAGEIGALPLVAVAAAATLLEYIVGWIIKKVAELFPNPSVFGWHPLGFINEGLNYFGNAVNTQAAAQVHILKTVFITPVRATIGMIQRLGNATGSAHNKISAIVVTHIPSAVRQAVDLAEHYVTGQVTNIDTQVSGAADRLVTLPSVAQAKTLLTDAKRYGGLGWDVTAAAAGAIVSAGDYAESLARQAASDLTTAINGVNQAYQKAVNDLHTELVKQLTGDEALLATLAQTVNFTLPAQMQKAITAAQTNETKQINDATSKLQGEIDSLQSQVTALNQATATDEANIRTAQANITTLQSATTVDEAAIATERQTILTAQSDILSNITSIQDLNTKITGISNTLAPIQTAQQLNTTQLAPFEGAGDVALPVALATISATLNSLKTKVDTCTVDTCDPTSPQNIRNVLKDLLGTIMAAAEIGFVAEAIRDPLGTASALAPILEGIDNGATSTFDDLMGLL